MANFDLKFDFGFDSDEERDTSNGTKRSRDSDSEHNFDVKRRRKERNLSETAKKFYSLESGESSDSEKEDERDSRSVNKKLFSTPRRIKRKVKQVNKLELKAKARLFHSFLGMDDEVRTEKQKQFLRGDVSQEVATLLRAWYDKLRKK